MSCGAQMIAGQIHSGFNQARVRQAPARKAPLHSTSMHQAWYACMAAKWLALSCCAKLTCCQPHSTCIACAMNAAACRSPTSFNQRVLSGRPSQHGQVCPQSYMLHAR